ncbi:MAG: DMT family transporter [Cyanobacteria bacterium J06642_11]
MLWFFLASGTALCESLKDAISKQALKSLDEYSVLMGLSTIGALMMCSFMLLTEGLPKLGPDYGAALLVGGSLNILAFTLYFRAIRTADLSLTVPLITLTPLFLLVTSPIIVQERPTGLDAIGVILLIIGSYILNSKPDQGISLAPLKAIVTNSGSRTMLGVALIWSITANYDKVGTLNSSSLFWGTSLLATIAIGMVPLVIQKICQKGWPAIVQPLRVQAKFLALAGTLIAIGISLQFIALTMAPVTQVIAVKRISALISVGLGYIFFGETDIKERLSGAAIMLSGVAIMAVD